MVDAGYIDDWLQRAFRLAYFLHGERDVAKRIVLGAFNKLEIASNAQFKRFYYTPQGRADQARATRSKVSLNDLQLLQRLVFVESEAFEKEKERRADERRLLVYFIKHLVRITLKRNSFYVALGVSRVLHNYATQEAMELYSVIVQDPERVHDDYYYRSRKGVLMKELKTRFGSLLESVKTARGEERFESRPAADGFLEIVRDSLAFFTPWATNCPLPEKFDPYAESLKSLSFTRKDPDDEHRIEINRIHAALHPFCFGKLVAALRLPKPEQRLEIPKFNMKTTFFEDDNDDRRNPPELDRGELRAMKDFLAAQAESRKAVTANLLRVVVDGEEQARINLRETGLVNFELGDTAELIEVRVVEKEGDVVLATHLLSFDDFRAAQNLQSVVLEGGQKVSFKLQPSRDEEGEIRGLSCGVEYEETEWQRRLALFCRRCIFISAARAKANNHILKPVFVASLLLLALSIGWLVFRQMRENEKILVEKNPPATNQNPINAPLSSNQNQIENLAPKNVKPEEKRKSGERPKTPNAAEKTPEKAPSPKPKINVVAPETVLANKEKPKSDRREKATETGVYRFSIREKPVQVSPDDDWGASRNAVRRAKELSGVKFLYIEETGDEKFARQIREHLFDELGRSKTFAPTQNKEQADAALKIDVRRESDDRRAENGIVTVVVRVVNIDGFVIYPTRKNVTAWKYVGRATNLPARIARDLVKAKTGK